MNKLLLLSAVLLLLGCGGSSENDGGAFPSASGGTGVFLDSPVAGVQYRVFFNDGNVGDIKVTDSNGRFSYEGDTFAISFFLGRDPVGRINLGSSTIKPTITLLDLLPEGETRAIDHPRIVAMAQLLQSLDDDGNITDTINISSETLAKIDAMSMDSADTLLDLDNDPATKLANVLQDIVGDDANLIPADSAQQHFRETLTNIADDIPPLSPRSLLGLYFDTNGNLCFYPDYPLVSTIGQNNVGVGINSTHTIYYPLDEFNAYISDDSSLNADNYQALATKYPLSNSHCISGFVAGGSYYGLLEVVNAYGSAVSDIYSARATPAISIKQQQRKDSNYQEVLEYGVVIEYKDDTYFLMIINIGTRNLLFGLNTPTIEARTAQNILIQQLENLANSDVTTNGFKYQVTDRSHYRPWIGVTINRNGLDFIKESPLIISIQENTPVGINPIPVPCVVDGEEISPCIIRPITTTTVEKATATKRGAYDSK